MGIAHVPEGRGVFANMSVRENLEMGAYTRTSRKEIEESFERVFDLFPRLAERATQLAGTLSGGEQQMLAIGRGLVQRPDLLLLDEPSMGLSPVLVSEIFRMIAEINKAGTTILTRRTERVHGPRHRDPRLRARVGGDRPRREGVRPAGGSEGTGRLPGRRGMIFGR